MRIRPLSLLSVAVAALAPLAAARGAQVYLHPAPPQAGLSAPTLSKTQAEAVIAHHLGADVSSLDAPGDEGVWGHLLNLWEGGSRPRVVIVEDAEAQEVLPATLKEPTFYLDDESESVLDPYIDSARESLERVASLPLVKGLLDTLDLAASRASEALASQLSALVALADSLWASAETTWDAVSISLGDSDADASLRDTATKGLRAGLETMTQDDSPPLLLVIMPPRGSYHYKRAASPADVPKLARADECLSNRTCSSRGCSGHGKCVEVSKGCFSCACAAGYAGVECQKTDYSAQFGILVGTAVLLSLGCIGAIALLFSVGETQLPSTLTLAVGGHKRD